MKKLFFTICILLITSLAASSVDEQRVLLEKDCKKGNSLACHEVKLMYGEESVETLKKESFKEACEEGNPGACHNMGLMHDYGDGAVVENDNIAIDFYEKACDKNYFESCTRAAFLYEEGKDVEVNMKKAFKLYSKACGANDGLACHNVAVYYSQNKNESIKKLAIYLYDKACKNGNVDSCIYMGRYYRDSKSLRRDYAKAKEKFEMACKLKNALGCKEVRILEGLGY